MINEGVSLKEIVINDLASRSLNSYAIDPSKDMVEAVDGLENMLRRAALGVMVGLFEVADAIRETKETG